MNQIDADEARGKLSQPLDQARTEGLVTIIRKRGVPCAAIVPLSHLQQRDVKCFSSLRGSAEGLYGKIAKCIEDERRW